MKHIKAIKVGSPGWQTECWHEAKSKQAFAVEDFSDKNQPFFEELCFAYQYQMTKTENQAIFTPLVSK